MLPSSNEIVIWSLTCDSYIKSSFTLQYEIVIWGLTCDSYIKSSFTLQYEIVIWGLTCDSYIESSFTLQYEIVIWGLTCDSYIESSFTLQYEIVIWGLTCDSYIKSSFTLQMKAVRAITFENYYVPSSIFLALELPKLRDLFDLKLLSFVYESVNIILSIVSICSLICFQIFTNIILVKSTEVASFYFVNSRYYCGLRSVTYAGAKSWNSILIQIK